MSNEDGSASSLTSTDTKLYLEELKALDQSGESEKHVEELKVVTDFFHLCQQNMVH